MERIGVFVCRCGTNIAAVVDVAAVVAAAKNIPGVIYSEENPYLFGDRPGFHRTCN